MNPITKKSRSLKSITMLVSSSIIAQILTVISSPFMTRLYSPGEIGEYTLVLSVLAMFGTSICGKYDAVIVSAKEPEDAFALTKLATLVAIFTSLLISIVYATYNLVSSVQINVTIFTFMVLIFICNGLLNVTMAYSNRNGHYKVIASTSVARAAAKDSSMVLFGFLKMGALGLLISQFLGTAVGISRQAKSMRGDFKTICKVPVEQLKAVAKKYKKQPLFSATGNIANSASYSILNLFINSLFGTSILGYYFVSYRILGLPLNVISSNVSKVYFEKASKEYNSTGSYYRTFKKTLLFILPLTVVGSIVLYFFAPWACEILFGSGWHVAGDYIRILTPMFALRFISSTLSQGMIISNVQQKDFILSISFIISSVVVYLVARQLGLGIIEYLRITSISCSVIYAVYFITLFWYARKKKEI